MPALIREVDDAIARGSTARRADHLRRVTDLFLRDAPALTDEQVDLFDVVIARLAAAIEARARAELAERLADAPNAPRGVIRTLAHDDIDVARPVLARSNRLSDEDLVAVAIAKGREHMLAISARGSLSEPVTDVLVKRGDRTVVHAVAANPGARFSDGSMTELVDRARVDEVLQEVLDERGDLPEEHVRQLVAIAKETARRRLSGDAERTGDVDQALEIGASAVRAAVLPGGRDLGAAFAAVSRIAATRPITEGDVATYARDGRSDEAICAIAFAADLGLGTAERLFKAGDSELLVVVARAQGWAFGTLEPLLKLREPTGASGAPHTLKRARDAFEQLRPQTAQRVVQFLKAREASQKRAAEAAAERQLRASMR